MWFSGTNPFKSARRDFFALQPIHLQKQNLTCACLFWWSLSIVLERTHYLSYKRKQMYKLHSTQQKCTDHGISVFTRKSFFSAFSFFSLFHYIGIHVCKSNKKNQGQEGEEDMYTSITNSRVNLYRVELQVNPGNYIVIYAWIDRIVASMNFVFAQRTGWKDLGLPPPFGVAWNRNQQTGLPTAFGILLLQWQD